MIICRAPLSLYLPLPFPISRLKSLEWGKGEERERGCTLLRSAARAALDLQPERGISLFAFKSETIGMNRISFKFAINQHSRDNLLIMSFSKYLNCGDLYKVKLYYAPLLFLPPSLPRCF